jgi:hypothetical protein
MSRQIEQILNGYCIDNRQICKCVVGRRDIGENQTGAGQTKGGQAAAQPPLNIGVSG